MQGEQSLIIIYRGLTISLTHFGVVKIKHSLLFTMHVGSMKHSFKIYYEIFKEMFSNYWLQLMTHEEMPICTSVQQSPVWQGLSFHVVLYLNVSIVTFLLYSVVFEASGEDAT